MRENDLSKIIVSTAYQIHTKPGPGLLESVFQKGIPVIWNAVNMKIGFRADLIVENLVIVELKSVETVLPVHQKQLLTYLKLTNLKLGLLINFNETLIKNGITRIVNNL